MLATPRRPNVSSLPFPGAYRRAVLALLLLHPERKLHVREIARLTGTTAGTLNKELARLHEAKLLERERVGNQLFYWADQEHQIYAELSSILAKTIGLADVLVEALAPSAPNIDVALVFGSIARGTATRGSDVDVLILGSVDFGSRLCENSLTGPRSESAGRPAGVVDEPIHRGGAANAKRAVS